MRGGRFVCVGLPIILTIGAIIAFLIAALSGIAHNSLFIFSVDLNDLTLTVDDLSSLVGDLNLDDIDISGLGGIGGRRRQEDGISASDLGLGRRYEVNLWGYCEIRQSGGPSSDQTERNCTAGEYNWAAKHIRTDFIDDLGSVAGINIQVPEEIDTAVDLFSTLTRYTEIAFIAALSSLGAVMLLGLFAICTRVMSCLTWLVGLAAIVLCVAAAGMATAMGAVVVGAVEATAQKYGVRGTINTSFLACVWIGAGLALISSLFFLFTICCCSPDHGRDRSARRHRHLDSDANDAEKLMATGPSTYHPLGSGANDTEMTSTSYHNQFQPTYGQGYGHAPSDYSGARSETAYEPYSHRP